MKIVSALVLGSLLVAELPVVAADAGSIIKQRARSVANQPQPQRPAPAPQPAPVRPVQSAASAARPVAGASTNAVATSALTAEQEAALNQVLADLNTIKVGAKPTPAQTAKVQTSLSALSTGATKPPEADVAKLAGGLTSAWGTQKMTPVEQQRFAKELRRVLNHSTLPPGEADAAVNGARTLLKYSGVSESTADQIVTALTGIASPANQ